MALPKWITPAGDLGVVPELEYYEYLLDAYDPSAGTLVYSRISGKLPLGIQITPTGTLRGIPVSESGGDQNVEYTFTIRAKNSTTNGLADRTFVLTITNVQPPVISEPTRDSFLGVFLDGSEYEEQLEAVEATPGATITWSLKSGELPPGILLSSTGLLSGYFIPIESPIPGQDADWDQSAWAYLGWDSSTFAIKKRFTFTVEASDGVNSDLSTYTLDVYPRGSLTADRTDLTVDITTLGTGEDLTVDTGNKHDPIILTKQSDLVNVREGTFYSFKFQGIDLDGDLIEWSVPAISTGAFDEQTTPLYDYVAGELVDGRLTKGIFPDIATVTNSNTNVSTSTLDYTQAFLEPGTTIKVISAGVWNLGTVSTSVTVDITGNALISASAGHFLTQESSGANATITSVSTTTGNIDIAGEDWTGQITTLLPTYNVTFSGPILANVGDYITQTISGGNARVTSLADGVNNANVIFITNTFTNGTAISGSNIQIRGSAVSVYPTANVKDNNNVTLTANIGEYVTQDGYTGNAVITQNISDAVIIPVRLLSGDFSDVSGNVKIGGVDVRTRIQNVNFTAANIGASATVGDYIYQYSTGANAIVTSNVSYGTEFPVRYLTSNRFQHSSNINLSNSNINAYITSVFSTTEVTATYSDANYFDINGNLATAIPKINGTSLAITNGNISSISSVGVTLGGLATEGTVGFDADKFDQGTLTLPPGLELVQDSGWLYGDLPQLTASSTTYEFEVIASKENDLSYRDTQLFTLTLLGDIDNRIDWITASDLGTITTGEVSDLSVYAVSSVDKTVFYELTPGAAQRLPQGLELLTTGAISGRVSFQAFSLDLGGTTTDKESTTFDREYTFSVTARDGSSTVTSVRVFKLKTVAFDKIPYENLYLKAFPTQAQRTSFLNVVNDSELFPTDKIYRIEDPWFGLAKDIKTLFLAGLSASTLAEYIDAIDTNHFTKRLTFGDVKTAQAVDTNFNVKYEVVYLEISDAAEYKSGNVITTASDTIYLDSVIENPYLDPDGNEKTIAYPNALTNMGNVVVNNIQYQDKGVLPDWMTSRQEDGRQLGFTRAVVLAYVKPGESNLIAYRLKERGFNFNTIDFSIDRYQLDNILSENFDIASNVFVGSTETTFDRYPALSSTLTSATTVDYALSTQYEDLNGKYVQTIKNSGGLDGIKTFKDGDTLVFAKQEHADPGSTSVTYENGWSNVIVAWDEVSFDDDVGASADSGWDQANYIPGQTEYLIGPSLVPGAGGTPSTNLTDGNLYVTGETVYSYDEDANKWHIANQRVAVWKVNINADEIVDLTLVRGMDYYDTAYVRNGFTYGGTNIYFDPIVKTGNIVPNYTIVPQEIDTKYTTFDGNGTRFYNNRDNYVVPEQGDKYIKFVQTGVFT